MVNLIYSLSNYQYLVFNYNFKLYILIRKNKYNFLFSILKMNILNNYKQLYQYILKKNLLLYNYNNLYYANVFNIGLGFKNFVYNKYFYIYQGDGNYYKLMY